MKLPHASNTAALVLALAVLSDASASVPEAAAEKDTPYPAPIARRTGLRKGGRRRAQGAQQRAIICEAQGEFGLHGFAGLGLCGTALKVKYVIIARDRETGGSFNRGYPIK